MRSKAETGFGDALLHGEAVALGIRLAFDLSAQLGLCPAAAASRVRAHFQAVGLPVALSQVANGKRFDPAALLAHMAHDKKVRDRKITLILARDIGDAFVSRDVEPAILESFLAAETDAPPPAASRH